MTHPLTEQESTYMDLANEAFRIADGDEVYEVLEHLVRFGEAGTFLESATAYLKEYINAH